MKPNTIHNQLLNVIKERLPQKKIVDILTDILHIGKEAIYRRLRGEVSFTLEEAAAIGIELGISIDDIMGNENPKSRPFQLKLTGFVNPTLEDYAQKDEYIEFLKNIVQISNTETGSYGNSFDFNLIYDYEYITRLAFLKWYYQRNPKESKSFGDIILTEKQNILHKEYVRLSKEIKKTCYIWDYMIFQYIINDINYFRNVRFITDEELILIKQDLYSFVDKLEKIATDGCFDTGNSVEFYISNINFESSCSYLQADYINLSLIRAFTINSLASTNHRTTEDVKNWILSQKRLATLISESGEMQRIEFFKKQRELIDTI